MDGPLYNQVQVDTKKSNRAGDSQNSKSIYMKVVAVQF